MEQGALHTARWRQIEKRDSLRGLGLLEAINPSWRSVGIFRAYEGVGFPDIVG
jgi:hypothetical protein